METSVFHTPKQVLVDSNDYFAHYSSVHVSTVLRSIYVSIYTVGLLSLAACDGHSESFVFLGWMIDSLNRPGVKKFIANGQYSGQLRV